MNPSTNSSGILNGRFITYPSLSKIECFRSFPVRAASVWRPSFSYAPRACQLSGRTHGFGRQACPGRRNGRLLSSGAGANDCPFPDPVDIHGKAFDLVVQRLLRDAQKHCRRLNVALLAPQRVLDDRPLDVLQLSRQRHIRCAKPGLVDRPCRRARRARSDRRRCEAPARFPATNRPARRTASARPVSARRARTVWRHPA